MSKTKPMLTKKQALRYLQATMSTSEWNGDTADHIVTLLTQAGYPLVELADDQYVLIHRDVYYEPDGDYDLDEERRKLASGELGAYVVTIQRLCECGNYKDGASLSGVVVEGDHHESTYSTIESIGDQYLREIAFALLTEEEASA